MKPLIVANWKMNPQILVEAGRLFNSVNKRINNAKRVEVVVCPPFVYLSHLSDLLSRQRKSQILILGAQDCFWEQKGAFTGEISPKMLKDLGVEYVIIGHSERRKILKESDEMINKKLKAAISVGLKPILCFDKLSQIPSNTRKIILAFEPLSAIGTGKPYSFEKAKKMRLKIKHPFVLYGGSVDSKNALDYIRKAGFQGLLVGGASLHVTEFTKIVKSVINKKDV
jgi:triosephosphate isomerase